MCGLFAAIKINGFFSEDDLNNFNYLTDLVKYRGPDARGYSTINTHSKNDSKSQFNVFLGHRRLSIIDLSIESNQPMIADGLYIVFNGEIYNYLELKAELINVGEKFQTKSDTEVILKMYKKYGEDSFSKFNGMWSFIIVDSIKNIIVVSRDRFSVKPLYILKTNNELFFASEIKQLLPLKKSIAPNTEVLKLFLAQGLSDISNKTFIDGIEKLSPRTNLIFNLSTCKIHRKQYWDFSHETISEFDYASDRFRELFIDAVKIRLRSDVKVGALLSGGLDSSAITLIANEFYSNNLETYSVVTNDHRFNEEKYVDILVQDKGLKNEKLRLNYQNILTNINLVIKQQDEPFNYLIVVAHYCILETIKESSNLKVVLSGQGGDEGLAGYLRFFFFYVQQLYNEKKYLKALNEIWFSLLYRTVITQFRFNAAKRYLPGQFRTGKKFLLFDTDYENVSRYDNMREYQINDFEKYSVPILTRYEDRNSMAHSMEIRLPFLDYRLVNLMINLDPAFKIKNGWNKYILRKSLQVLPNEIRWRRDKKGFSLPEAKWLKNDFRDEIKNLFSKSLLHELGFINQRLFLEYYTSFVNGNNKIHSSDISRVFFAEKWARGILGFNQ